jgi:hypothetical protein
MWNVVKNIERTNSYPLGRHGELINDPKSVHLIDLQVIAIGCARLWKGFIYLRITIRLDGGVRDWLLSGLAISFGYMAALLLSIMDLGRYRHILNFIIHLPCYSCA